MCQVFFFLNKIRWYYQLPSLDKAQRDGQQKQREILPKDGVATFMIFQI